MAIPITREEYQARFGKEPPVAPVAPTTPRGVAAPIPLEESVVRPRSLPQKIYESERDFATGVAKGATSTFLGLGSVGRKIQKAVGKGIDAVTGGRTNLAATAQGGIFDPTSPAGARARQLVVPKNTSEKLGKGTEQIAEFFLPGAAAAKGEKVLVGATKALPGVTGALARIGGKGLIQGIPAAGVSYIQTGGDARKAALTGVTAGAVRAGFATIGEGARAIHIPERLYQMVFKNTRADALKELNSSGLSAYQKNYPQEYAKLVSEGIIRTGKGGTPVVNDTLAEQAIERGLKGSISTMGNQVVRGKYLSESAVRDVARNYKGTVDIPETQFQNVLREIAEEYDNVGFGETSSKALRLATKLKDTGGKVSAEDALELRRFLDALRMPSGYEKPVLRLSTSEANLKTLADAVRTRLNSVPGMGTVMKDYSFHIEALEALANEAKRTGNNQLMGLIDSVFLAEGLAGNTAVPLAGGVIRRVVNSASGATRLGSSLANQALRAVPSSILQGVSSQLTPPSRAPAMNGTSMLPSPGTGPTPTGLPLVPTGESLNQTIPPTGSNGKPAIPITREEYERKFGKPPPIQPVSSRNPLGNARVGRVQIPKQARLAYVNNNPGNLKFVGQTGAVRGEKGFARFRSPQEGFNALIRQVKLDASRGLSLAKFVHKFAPPSENNTRLYIAQLAKRLGVSASTPIARLNATVLAKEVARKESSTHVA